VRLAAVSALQPWTTHLRRYPILHRAVAMETADVTAQPELTVDSSSAHA